MKDVSRPPPRLSVDEDQLTRAKTDLPPEPASRPSLADWGDREDALLGLSAALKTRGYRFVTPGNGTIRTIRRRPDKARAADLRDIFGWSLPFDESALEPELMDLMRRAEILNQTAGGWRSTVRVSSIDDALFLHSAFPTTASDAVFFGPDTYRYVRFLRAKLAGGSADIVVDIGAGSGAGGVMVRLRRPQGLLILTDVNAAALDLARINAQANGVACEYVESSGLAGVTEAPDLIIANPPFIADRDGHTYQAGGDDHGLAVSAAWAEEGMQRLRPDGRMLLYTGSAIVGGADPFREKLAALALRYGCGLEYEEIDPDIFGGELRRAAYAQVERIAAVGAVIRKGA